MNKTEEKIHDLIIVGAGPAGLTAAIYAGRYLLDVLVIGELPGGTISEASEVCNFPTHPNIDGMSLSLKMVDQVNKLGIKIKQETVENIKLNSFFEVKTNTKIYRTKKIILAVGRKRRKLNLEKEKELLGRGISYCATCDAGFYENKTVAVIGGSNSALTASLLLSKYAEKVYLIYRRNKYFRAEPAWIKNVESEKNIISIFNSTVKKIKGTDYVTGLVLNNNKELKVDGVFVEIGSIPYTKLAKQLGLELEKDYIKVDKFQRTSVPGVFAAGDITNNPLKQAITACGEGAICANSAYEEISGGI